MLRCTRTSLASSIRQLSTQSTNSTSIRSTGQLLKDLDQLLLEYPILDHKWTERLQSAITDLESKRRANISSNFYLSLSLSRSRGSIAHHERATIVVGDRDSSVQGVTTSILDDPLVNDQDVTIALEARRLANHTPEAIKLQYVAFNL